jgi:hypothetical protein
MWREGEVLTKVHRELSHAVTSPPDAPVASTETKERREEGRKEAALEAGRGPSFDSWSPIILGLAEVRSDLTTSHLSLSPKPRTFHEPTVKQIVPIIGLTHRAPGYMAKSRWRAASNRGKNPEKNEGNK